MTDLDPDLASAFCDAHFEGSAKKVMQGALRTFIKDQLSRDLATKERSDELQKKRNGGKPDGSN